MKQVDYSSLCVGGHVFVWVGDPPQEIPNGHRCHCGLTTYNKPMFTLETIAFGMADALRRLRDCDWTISLPDRMDAVRDIARKALEPYEKWKGV